MRGCPDCREYPTYGGQGNYPDYKGHYLVLRSEDGEVAVSIGSNMGTAEEVAGDIFQRESDVMGREGMEEEERESRDRMG